MKTGIAFFDFDGTITRKDSLLEFIKYQKGRSALYAGFLLNSPWLLAYKLDIISNQAAKERVLTFFFGKTPVGVFQEQCDHFAEHVIPGLIRPKAMEEIDKLKKEGVLVVIVSASPENWISKWASQHGLESVSTQLAVKDGLITGKIAGKNCHGKEKVHRIRKQYDLRDYEKIYAYGDSSGDLAMMGLAGYTFMKPFR